MMTPMTMNAIWKMISATSARLVVRSKNMNCGIARICSWMKR